MKRVTPAQRVRTMLAVPSDLWLETSPGAEPLLVPRHVVVPGGAIVLARPAGCEVQVGQVLTLSGTDVASVPQRDRVRGRMRLRGTLTPYDGPRSAGVVAHLQGPDLEAPEPVLARFTPVAVELAWACEAASPEVTWERVDLDAYRTAAPEPFCGHELSWLPHLQRDHDVTLRSLATRAYGLLDSSIDVRALGLDRFGLVLRLYSGADSLDVRLDFAEEVECGCDVREAIAALVGERGLDRLDHRR